MSDKGQSVPMRTPLASYEVRNSLKADLVKRLHFLTHHPVKPVRPNAVSPLCGTPCKSLQLQNDRTL